MSRYLNWTINVVKNLREHQTLNIGSQSQAELCLTYARGFEPEWTSTAIYGEKNIQLYHVPPKPIEPSADFMDLAAWSWLERLSTLTGDSQYTQLVDGMSAVYRDYGFDPRSGLGYLGQEAVLNVKSLAAAAPSSTISPRFKPGPEIPIARFWRDMPDKTARMCKAAYYGLITRPENFDYNRFCYYAFRDTDKKPALTYDSGHVAFAQTASWLIGWWVDHYRRTGDLETLEWATRMTQKYRAVQGEKTGLIPHWFGNGKSGDPTQNPQPMCNSGDSHTAIAFLEDSVLARGDSRSEKLANDLHDMGLRLMRALCKYGYDDTGRHFPAWLKISDGSVDEAIVYAFRTQAEKDYWVKKDPRLSVVSVYAGDGLFQGGPWTYGSGPALIPALSKGLLITRDPELIAYAQKFAAHALEGSRALKGALNDKRQWTFPASASYASLMVNLHKVTGDATHLVHAQHLLDRELEVIDQPQSDGRPEWWRMSYRNTLIRAALDLHEALM